MCKFKLFSIAAAALMMVACSTEDLTQQTQTKAGKMQFSATIAAPSSGATTRTIYTEDTQNKKITVAWKVGDEIALVHNKVKDVATVEKVNDDGSATIAGIITGATNEAGVQLYYPAALVKSVTNDGNPVFDNDLWGKISTQDGTLKYIQDNLDFRSAKGQLSVNETSATLKEAATMNSMHAIWKLTLQNDAETPAALSAKKVSVQMTADVPILRASTAELTTPISSFYLAMEPFTGPITIEATVGDDTYKYEKKSVSIASGKYYQSTVTMAKASAEITVTITQNDLPPTGNKSFTKDGVTVTANDIVSSLKTILGPGSFTTTLGNFTKIEVTGDDKPTGTGWTSGVWTGNASTVEFTGGSIAGFMSDAFTIVCTIQPAKATNAYLKWDGTQKKLVATPMPDTYTTVTSSTTTWAAGTYVVDGEVTISGNVTLNGNVDLIIKDGAKLTAKQIYGSSSKYNLSIYGQANQTGQLVVNCSDDDAITSITKLEVHSCQVTATSSSGGCGGFYEISAFNVYGGSVDAEYTGSDDGYGIWLLNNGSMNIYGGDVTAVGKGSAYYGIYSASSSTVTVYGGKLWAECAGKKAIDFDDITLTKDAGYTSGKIEYSMDKTDWSETKNTNAKYVRVGY